MGQENKQKTSGEFEATLDELSQLCQKLSVQPEANCLSWQELQAIDQSLDHNVFAFQGMQVCFEHPQHVA